MEVAIGIRVSPNKVYFSVVSEWEDEVEIKLIDHIVIPKSLETPEQLKFLRSTMSDIINENKVLLACIRITESNARTVNVPRIYMEGVIQELIASSSINKYYVGQISNISAKLGINRADFKPYANNNEVFMDFDFWSEISLEERESIMAAFSALNL
ncbi:hypothetical protein M0G43_01280 [Subsaxibacter sp. CAU 1640]|uniref:hypothetical protein n=1 Tax=Subsaxibacter sp. CAU 1640 TaxID=2933271 RepID=UPI0020052318|nr:hypothetical protein [Subsaxibacter sp. CAU 1640]MCK7589196.1 hypothetical protein [Subsaxibacter sp. CAU 1640]